MEPERIIAKDCDGVALVRWVLNVSFDVAYLTTEEGLAAIMKGETPPVVGWRLADVYLFTPDSELTSVEWAKMTPWAAATASDTGLSRKV